VAILFLLLFARVGFAAPAAQQRSIVNRRAPEIARPDVNGRRIALKSLRGKVVLLNFWATWCTACLAEIPDLIALKKKLGDRVVVLGVALDGWSTEPDSDENHQTISSAKSGSSKRLDHSKIDRAIRLQGINYTVLLDPTGLAGSPFNGGELPTTVIVDTQGRMRRRFVGERNLAVFDAMVAEASGPASP